MKRKFNQSTHRFKCYGIEMIGNTETGVVIGLDEHNAQKVDEFINNHFQYDIEAINSDLLKEFEQSGFFETDLGMTVNTAYFHVTSRCNLKCIGCYSDEENRNSKADLETEQILRIIDNLSETGIHNLIISGGEPYLRNDLVSILKYAKEVGHIPIVQIVSNGMVERSRYDATLEYIDAISISVDGYNETTHFLRNSNMRYVLETVQYLSQKTNKVSMIFTINSKNVEHIEEYCALSNKLNVPCSFSLLTVSDSKTFEQVYLHENEYDMLKLTLSKSPIFISDTPFSECLGCKESCGLGKRIISISSNGDIYPCHMLHSESLRMGNALHERILSVIENTFERWNVLKVDECKQCEYKFLCGGGCYARRFLNSSIIAESHDPCCEIYKTEIRRIISDLLS